MEHNGWNTHYNWKRTFTHKEMSKIYDESVLIGYTNCISAYQKLDLTPEEQAIMQAYAISISGRFILFACFLCVTRDIFDILMKVYQL